ncbi:Uncharacterised protein [Salmonella enterica subsp. arizonae]|nr:Uncharacterised protein [Salmonella enterica subsp. arizonae]
MAGRSRTLLRLRNGKLPLLQERQHVFELIGRKLAKCGLARIADG